MSSVVHDHAAAECSPNLRYRALLAKLFLPSRISDYPAGGGGQHQRQELSGRNCGWACGGLCGRRQPS
jgi:hypothetical protein